LAAVYNVSANFGFLVFGVTDYAAKLTTLHYGAVGAREPRTEDVQSACRKPGQRLAEWVVVYVDRRGDEHPLQKPGSRMGAD
jgi:NAD(P)H dehydrogenase (quinone)